MVSVRSPRTLRTIPVLIAVCFVALPAQAKYSGGTGEPNDPYQIATGADLIALGETPADYDRHFILTADIDLDPNLPGRKVFDKAVIAPDTEPNDGYAEFQGAEFIGVLDGNGRTISNLTIVGAGYLGLFGHSSGTVSGLGIVHVNIIGSGSEVGGLMGLNGGDVTGCYSTGSVRGGGDVGGLMGYNYGIVTACYSSNMVSGQWGVGALIGGCEQGSTTRQCHSTGAASGEREVGGLVGVNLGSVAQCYSMGTVSGISHVGGLVGRDCVGSDGWSWPPTAGPECGVVTACFWDMQTSAQATSAGGTGETTAEMQTAKTFLEAGWDFVGETANGSEDIWKIAEGLGYPRLSWEKYSGGTGEPNDPYQIATATDLIALGETPEDYDKCFILTADIDLDPNLPGCKVFDKAVIAPDTDPVGSYFQGSLFAGILDGNAHTISNLSISGTDYLGLLGCLAYTAKVRNLSVVDADIIGSGCYVGGLAGHNVADVTHCHSTGTISGGLFYVGGLLGINSGNVADCSSACAIAGGANVGGLIGGNESTVTQCHSAGTVMSEEYSIGGLVGHNHHGGALTDCDSTCVVTETRPDGDGWDAVGGLVGSNDGAVTGCCSSGTVRGGGCVGGLVGANCHNITLSYNIGTISGDSFVGGLVGDNTDGAVTQCYSAGAVSGKRDVGGLIGWMTQFDLVNQCFWDVQTSGQTTSAGGTGKTTAEMQTASTFLDAGWDFVDETANGTEDIWWILEGKDYPHLWWEKEAD